MQVTAVGDATENGKVYKAAQIDNSVKTPLSEQLDWLGLWVSRLWCCIGLAGGVARVGMGLGTVGDGLAPRSFAGCDYTVRIPMSHGVDSLNVAAASAVAFWQLGARE